MKIVRSIRFDDKDWQQVNKIAAAEREPVSVVIRRLIREGLKKSNGKA